MSAKVCVTGGTGFIGRELVARLLSQGYTVVVPTRAQKNLHQSNGRLQYVEIDLSDVTVDLTACITGCEIVINCAGEIHNTAQMQGLHVHATQRLLDAFVTHLKSHGRKGRWVQLSSVGAYGPARPAHAIRVVTEDTQPAPMGDYEISKTLADELVKRVVEQNSDVLTYSILRPSNVCGPRMPNNALRAWARAIQKGVFFFVGPKDSVSTYVHVKDVADALAICASHQNATNQIFNLSNDCQQIDLVGALAKAVGAHCPRLRAPEWLARGVAKLLNCYQRFPLKESRVDSLVARTSYPCDKLRKHLDFTPQRNIPAAIKDIIKSA